MIKEALSIGVEMILFVCFIAAFVVGSTTGFTLDKIATLIFFGVLTISFGQTNIINALNRRE